VPPFALARLATVALGLTVFHGATIGEYGIFRDELYYLACGRRLAWGYVDHPPLVAVMARAGQSLFGDTVPGVRVIPVALAAFLVMLTGALARRFGGGQNAQVLAGVAVAIAPSYLFLFHILSMNSADVVLWTLALYLVVVALQTSRGWPWLAFGLVAGVGLLNKHSMLLLGTGVFVGLLLSGRQHLRRPWVWMGGAIAVVLFAPHVLWQVRNGWPTLEFIENARAYKIAATTPLGFMAQQIVQMHPLTVPIWIAGVWSLARPSVGAPYRVLAWMYGVVLAVLVIDRSKPYYLAPVYPLLFAAGAAWLDRVAPSVRGLRSASVAVLIAGGLALAPAALPLLRVPLLQAYLRTLGMVPSSGERHELGALPQHFADMHGWDELAETVSAAFRALPAEEQTGARVLARNYGEAGALERLSRRYSLPAVISMHNNYWLWGPGPDGGVMLIIGGEVEDHLDACSEVEIVARTSCRYCMPYERDQAIFVCRGSKEPLSEIWKRGRNFN
jgi:hypothetical protein